MLFHLIYVSTATNRLDNGDLSQLLYRSRRRNQRNRVTGMLLYKDKHFMQVLEGNETNVMNVFASIEKDFRHKGIDVLRAEYIQHRDFPDWSMGFRNASGFSSTTVPGFTDFLEADFDVSFFAEDPKEAYRMLLALKESGDG
jgi:hypothetical protein